MANIVNRQHKKVPFASWIMIFVSITQISSCNCSNIDCAYEARFNFKLIDKDTGVDLIYTANLPLSEFKLTSSGSNEVITIEKLETNQSLVIFFNPSVTDYKLEYKLQTITLVFKVSGLAGECCMEYSVTSVNSNIDTVYSAEDQMFTLKL